MRSIETNHRRRYASDRLNDPRNRNGAERMSDLINTIYGPPIARPESTSVKFVPEYPKYSSVQYLALVNGPGSDWRLSTNHVLGRNVYCATTARCFFEELLRDYTIKCKLESSSWPHLQLMFERSLAVREVCSMNKIKANAIDAEIANFYSVIKKQYQAHDWEKGSRHTIPDLEKLLTPLLTEVLNRMILKPSASSNQEEK